MAREEWPNPKRNFGFCDVKMLSSLDTEYRGSRHKLSCIVEVPVSPNCGIYSICFNQCGDSVAAGYSNGDVKIHDASTGEVRYRFLLRHEKFEPITTIRYIAADGEVFLAGGTCGKVFLCSIDEYYNEACDTFVIEKNNEIYSLDIDSGGQLIATVGRDAYLRAYDVETAEPVVCYGPPPNLHRGKVKYDGHQRRVCAVKFLDSQQNVAITGGWDKCVKVWDLRTKEGVFMTIDGPYICGEGIDIKENKILTASCVAHNSLQQWDLRSGRLIVNIMPISRPATLDGEFFNCVKYFADNLSGDTVLAGGNGTGNLEVISIIEEKIVQQFHVHKAIKTLDNKGSLVAFGGVESMFRVAEVTADLSRT